MRNFPGLLFSLNFLYILLIAAQIAAIVFLCLYLPVFLPITLTLAVVWLVTTATAVTLFSRRGAAEVKCVWLILIAALPIAGALIYLFATIKKKPWGILNVEGNDGMPAEVGYDGAEYFKSGAEFFERALKEIENAEKSVYIEFFIISRGQIFNAACAALEKARARGAEIKIILDGIGSAFRAGRREFKRLKALGAEIKIFHKLTPFPRARINFRDHRKIVTVDGKVSFTGGINLADEYANVKSPYGYWKDGGVAVYGAAAKVFEGMFLSLWHGEYSIKAPEGGKYKCLPYYDSPPARTYCEDAYVRAISSANERVYIMTPYFSPGGKTSSALSFAAKRGVDVKVILPHIPDKKYAFAISKAYARELSKDGIEFYEFLPGFMHAKCLICDDEAYLGSYNFDYRSTHFNYECGVRFTGNICDCAEVDFKECLALSAELTEEKLPPAKRAARFFLKLFAPLV